MVIIRGKIAKIPLGINPYLTLGIKKGASKSETKIKFREKLNAAMNDDELRAKICFAYDIIVNNSFYIQIGKDTYKVDDFRNHAYFYTVVGDTLNLINEIEKDESLLNYKDPLKRNLLYIAARNGHTSTCEYLINKGINLNEIQSTGSTALHGASYYGQTNVVKLLLDYGAKTNIKNNFDHLPIDEAYTDEIKQLLKESEQDPIVKLYNSLLVKNIANSLIPISSQGNLIAKKITCKLINLHEEYKPNEVYNDWISAWHGTNMTCLESIAEIGLKPAGGKSKGGDEIKVCISHIGRNKQVDNIPDWANGIFVSPSVFYSGYPTYAKEIAIKNETFRVLVEVKVKPKSYYEHGSTCPNYVPKTGEPKMLEYRIDAKNEKDVQVVSLTFIKNEFFEKSMNYSDGNLLKTKLTEF